MLYKLDTTLKLEIQKDHTALILDPNEISVNNFVLS